MKNYIISGVLLLLFIGVTTLTVLLLIYGFEYNTIKIRPLLDVIEYPNIIDDRKEDLDKALQAYNTQKTNLENQKSNYESVKKQYDNISQSQIDRILEAYKKYNYDLEWLWIVLGNYAAINNLQIVINEPENANNAQDVLGSLGLTVRGRYLDVVDFIFDVENDKELLFKLDNMSMTYDRDNKIIATFDILTMNVIF